MKHTQILQGRKFISSKRASKIVGYSSDYIGQLCRAGKLDARMFGHSWFITAESLFRHKNGTPVNTDAPIPSSVNDNLDKDRISTKRAAEISGYATDYIGQLCRGGKLDARMIGNAWFVTEESVRAHMKKIAEEKARSAEAEALRLELIRELHPVEFKKYHSENYSRPTRANSSVRSSGIRSPFRTVAFFALSLLVIIFAAGYLVRSQNSAVSRPTAANVYDSFASAVAYLGEVYSSVISTLNHKGALTMNTDADSVPLGADGSGMVVMPADGAAAVGADGSKAQSPFSDQVAIKPDKSGTAGVITPVFKKANGHDYTYVLVPINGK